MKKFFYLICTIFCASMLSGCMGFYGMRQLADMQQLMEDTESSTYIMTEEKAYVFSDGTAASLWQSPDKDSRVHSYRLSDGQELIDILLPVSIDSFTVEGLSGTKAMEPKALEAARTYYDKMGMLLDIDALLENAYEDYKQCQASKKKFDMHVALQSSVPCVETDRFVGFLTEWDAPDSGKNGEYHSLYHTALFDRKTGEIIPVTDLFTVPPEEAIEILLDFCVSERTRSRDEVRPLITSDRVQWQQDEIELHFQAGELHDDDFEYSVVISYDEIKEYLHDWAIPDYDPE